jgi:hypothetical protein
MWELVLKFCCLAFYITKERVILMKGLIDLLEVLVFLFVAIKVIKAVLFRGKKRKAGIVKKLFSLVTNMIHHRINLMLIRQRKYYEKQYLAQKELEEPSDKNKVIKLQTRENRVKRS